MWFSNTTRNLANELNQWLEHLLSHRPPAVTRPHLQQKPQLLGSLERLQRDREELQRVRQYSEQQPPSPCTAVESAALAQRLSQAEQQCALLEDELRASHEQNRGLMAERTHWDEEQRVWELTKRTLTEGNWAMNVVGGDPDHAQNLIRWSEQFRELIGYSAREFPDGWDSYFEVVNADDLKQVMQAFNAAMVDTGGDGFYAVEYRMRHKTRGELWFRERGRCLRGAQGRLLHVTGAVREISNEKTAAILHQREQANIQAIYTQIAQVAGAIRSIAEQTNLCHRSGAGWRSGPRLCCGGRRGAQSGTPYSGVGAADSGHVAQGAFGRTNFRQQAMKTN